jgi:homopolymeric O-antigen transport system ATP-binding protein
VTDPIITVEGLGKKYRIRHERERYTALRDVLAEKAKGLFRLQRGKSKEQSAGNGSRSALTASPLPPSPSREDFWALRDVSFEVKRGEVLGIIGRNGAGKTTLLKILSRITEPTEGRVRIRGRVASLLEVGTGFHPELTGRENIYLNGAILGMSKAEIRKKFDEIVAFAETEKFLDTPVKRYSSGMYVRLAFAVAAHLEPEILIVDEVLAVGDAQFQKKCLGKMKEVSKGGRTVLFVSHNMTAVRALCTKAIRLQTGQLRQRGDVCSVVDEYLNSDSDELLLLDWANPSTAPGTDKIRLRRMQLDYIGKDVGEAIYTDTPIEVRYQFSNICAGDSPINISTHLRGVSGEVLFNVWSEKSLLPQGLVEGVLNIPGNFLNDGYFSLDFMVVQNGAAVVHVQPGLQFQVRDRRLSEWHGRVLGAVRPTFLKFPLTVIGDATSKT